jgi:(p)ppGpp synthase/HD superfamily hydrolase
MAAVKRSETMSTLEKAIVIAAQAHAGQIDKAGEPYILHPIRVMLRLKGEAERIAAVLHDLIEDTGWTLEQLREAGFSEEVIAALGRLTKLEGEAYEDFIRRVKPDPLAAKVKIADLEDNLDASRLREITEADRTRFEKYRRAMERLKGT